MNHLIANQILHFESYFCRPYCSTDKGSIENRNKILRQFLPKKTNFDLISQDTLDIIQRSINNSPPEITCLEYTFLRFSVRLATLIYKECFVKSV